jgi:ABC-2 type transport system ATP-binding protein
VRTPEPQRLAALVTQKGGSAAPDGDDALRITRLGMTEIGDLAFDNQIRVHELSPIQASLEQAFMELTKDSVEYHAAVPGQPAGAHDQATATQQGGR